MTDGRLAEVQAFRCLDETVAIHHGLEHPPLLQAGPHAFGMGGGYFARQRRTLLCRGPQLKRALQWVNHFHIRVHFFETGDILLFLILHRILRGGNLLLTGTIYWQNLSGMRFDSIVVKEFDLILLL
jgi:hypothetical protein